MGRVINFANCQWVSSMAGLLLARGGRFVFENNVVFTVVTIGSKVVRVHVRLIRYIESLAMFIIQRREQSVSLSCLFWSVLHTGTVPI